MRHQQGAKARIRSGRSSPRTSGGRTCVQTFSIGVAHVAVARGTRETGTGKDCLCHCAYLTVHGRVSVWI
jgi:hypothetical protein